MRIGVFSDTHLQYPDENLEIILNEIFAQMDLILHAGDIVSKRVLDRLEESGVLAVCGNMDDYDISDAIPDRRIIAVEDKRIGLMHGWGSKDGVGKRIYAVFEGDMPDLIAHGHTHVPYWGEIKGVKMFNPGSASRNRYAELPTVGILTLTQGEFSAQLINLNRSR